MPSLEINKRHLAFEGGAGGGDSVCCVSGPFQENTPYKEQWQRKMDLAEQQEEVPWPVEWQRTQERSAYITHACGGSENS